jgi:16S rRNA (uracil1498-N3)-methyltransferase
MITDSEFSPAAANRSAAHVIVASLEALELEDEDRRHLAKALRLRAGEAVSVTDGRGGWRLCRFRADGTVVPDGEVRRQPRCAPLLTVGFAPVKGDRPEWAVQKLTEIGVDRIVILSAERSVVRWTPERAPHHLTRLRGIVRQAVMQSRRVWVPELTGVVTAASLAADPGVAIAAPGGVPPQLAYPTVLVGPEGGWSPSEERAATTSIQLGPGILRTESAAVAAGVLLVALRSGLVRPA